MKEELRPRQCDEPKTPYHGPLDTDEELSLGSHAERSRGCCGGAVASLSNASLTQTLLLSEEAEMSPLALDEEVRPCAHCRCLFHKASAAPLR